MVFQSLIAVKHVRHAQNTIILYEGLQAAGVGNGHDRRALHGLLGQIVRITQRRTEIHLRVKVAVRRLGQTARNVSQGDGLNVILAGRIAKANRDLFCGQRGSAGQAHCERKNESKRLFHVFFPPFLSL